MVDEDTALEGVPEVGDADSDPSMEVVAGDSPEVADAELGTDLDTAETEASPEADAETAADDEADDEAEESSPAEDQANYEPPRSLDQASHAQRLMVAGNNAGQAQRRESLARNRERRRLQHEAIHKSSQG